MFTTTALLLALSAAQPSPNMTPQCHLYNQGRVFEGRIRQLRLRRASSQSWSAEDPNCDRFFFPAKLSPSLNAKLAKRITNAVNSRRGDHYVELDARVRIILDADHSGGVLTVLAFHPPR